MKNQHRPAQLGAAHLDKSEYGSDVHHIDLIARRQKYLGGSMLFYHDPVHLVRGQGVWLYDDQGKRYLDCYNNVASVGHCHPSVIEALNRQSSTLNTHTRYLSEPVIDYAEKLSSLMPSDLQICMFVNSGTEANELAMRIARTVSGNTGAIVMENSYHGNSTLMHEMSTIAHPEARQRPSHIASVEPPNTYRGPYRQDEHDRLGERYADLVSSAITELQDRGEGVAAFMCDSIFDTQGTLEAPKDYFERVYRKIRAAGGLCIADEVQPGLCRTGKWWGFENYNVVPDIVTLGKPMGDGHPLAVVVTTKRIAEAFASKSFYFNTFGGNPVSAVVGVAVVDACERERVPSHCAEVGTYFRSRLEDLSEHHSLIGNVRGQGLSLGVELVADRDSKKPATEIARQIPDALKAHGVLMGISGRFGNVIKIRPPLIFARDNVDQVIDALDTVLRSHA